MCIMAPLGSSLEKKRVSLSTLNLSNCNNSRNVSFKTIIFSHIFFYMSMLYLFGHTLTVKATLYLRQNLCLT